MATKKRINAREARREQALADIVNGMAGAFGDYVRSRMATGQGNGNGNNVVGNGQGNFNGNGPGFNPQAMMQARGPMPMGDGTGGPQIPMFPPSPPSAGDGTMGAAYPGLFPSPPMPASTGWDPGFVAPNVPTPPTLPGRMVTFEDGSSGMVGGQFDPGFSIPVRPSWLEVLMPNPMPPGRRF